MAAEVLKECDALIPVAVEGSQPKWAVQGFVFILVANTPDSSMHVAAKFCIAQ